jgi:hypothetical protein
MPEERFWPNILKVLSEGKNTVIIELSLERTKKVNNY